jgi:hypothetical protein
MTHRVYRLIYNDLAHRMTEAKSRLKAEADEVNRERKLRQVSAGAELKALEERWKSVVATNTEIEDACKVLEAEIRELEAKVPQKYDPPSLPPRIHKGGNIREHMDYKDCKDYSAFQCCKDR